MGKKLFISAAIVVILFGFIFLATVAGSFLVSQVSPMQTANNEALIPVSPSSLPDSNNMNADVEKMAAELDAIQEEVIGIRNLSPNETIYRNTLTPAEFRRRINDEWMADYSDDDIRRDVLFYALLDVVEPDFDMYGFIVDLYSEQVAGFYDSDSKEMVVIQGGLFGGPERMTYAHEFTHLLQDQNYGLEEGLNLSDELFDEDMDEYMAVQALVEGDAVLTEYLWYQIYATDQDVMDINQFAMEINTQVYDNAPWFIQNELLYPYQFGLEFLHTIYAEEGWAGVESVYANPPISTEQIMHPERYPDNLPLTVNLDALEDVFPADWRLLDESSFGEAYWYLTLMQQQNVDAPDVPTIWEAVKGWGGDRYRLYVDDASSDVIFVLQTTWDTEDDAKEFMDAYKTYAKLRWDGFDQQGLGILNTDAFFNNVNMQRNGSTTTWVFAPDKTHMDMVLSALHPAQD
jgi:hypothetical protein